MASGAFSAGSKKLTWFSETDMSGAMPMPCIDWAIRSAIRERRLKPSTDNGIGSFNNTRQTR
ncbi:hypothetical protein D3C80_1862930 [compost metagenome]